MLAETVVVVLICGGVIAASNRKPSVMTTERKAIYNAAMATLRDPAKLRCLAQAFAQCGFAPEAAALLQRAKLRDISPELSKARRAAFKAGMQSTDVNAIERLARAFYSQSATGAGRDLMQRATNLRAGIVNVIQPPSSAPVDTAAPSPDTSPEKQAAPDSPESTAASASTQEDFSGTGLSATEVADLQAQLHPLAAPPGTPASAAPAYGPAPDPTQMFVDQLNANEAKHVGLPDPVAALHPDNAADIAAGANVPADLLHPDPFEGTGLSDTEIADLKASLHPMPDVGIGPGAPGNVAAHAAPGGVASLGTPASANPSIGYEQVTGAYDAGLATLAGFDAGDDMGGPSNLIIAASGNPVQHEVEDNDDFGGHHKKRRDEFLKKYGRRPGPDYVAGPHGWVRKVRPHGPRPAAPRLQPPYLQPPQQPDDGGDGSDGGDGGDPYDGDGNGD